MDQVKFVEDSFLKNFTWSILEYFASNKLDTKLSNDSHSGGNFYG